MPAAANALANPAQWFNVLRQEAHDGNAEAMLELGIIYFKGTVRPQSFAQARAWFEAAAKREIPGARIYLGVMHERGLGVAKDVHAALRCYCLELVAGNTFEASIAIARLRLSQGKIASAGTWYRMALDEDSARKYADAKAEAERFLKIPKAGPPPPPPPPQITVLPAPVVMAPRGAVERTVVERDENGIPTRTIERPLDETELS